MARYQPTYRADITVPQGPGAEELAATLTQAKSITESCTKAALDRSNNGKGLSADQRTQLRSALREIKAQVSTAGDALRLRRSKVRKQLTRLQAEKAGVDANSASFSNYYRLMSPAIAVCPEAADTAAVIHGAIQPVVRQSTELNYKILLAQTQEGLLLQRINLVQAALAALDRAEYSIS